IALERSTNFRSSATFRITHGIYALGDKQLPTRRAQYNSLGELLVRLEEEGVNGISGQSPPFPPDFDASAREQWLMALPKGTHLFRAAATAVSHPARGLTGDAGTAYAHEHLGLWSNAGHKRNLENWTSTRTIGAAFQELASPAYFATATSKTLHKIRRCLDCSQPAITDQNGQHRNCTLDGASRTSQRGYRRLRFAHELLNEPYVTSTVPDIAEFLDDLGLELGSSADILVEYHHLLADLPFIPSVAELQPATLDIPPIVRYKKASKNHPQQLWAATVDRLLSVRPGVDGVRTDQPRMLNPEEEELQPLWNAVVRRGAGSQIVNCRGAGVFATVLEGGQAAVHVGRAKPSFTPQRECCALVAEGWVPGATSSLTLLYSVAHAH
ncbi:uncharacterized protein MKK02DRAFT_28274, partial [Dioszegia hungarica]